MRTPKKPYTYNIVTSRLTAPSAVVAELERLNHLLAEGELLPVVYFNRAYITVTRKIAEATALGRFKYPEQMNALEVAFARKYFDALNHYVEYGFLPGAWNKLIKGRFHKNRPSSLSLLLGANAHINYDLLPALKEAVRSPEEFMEDYFALNQLLLESGEIICKGYYEASGRTNYFKKGLSVIYLKPVIHLMIRWRTRVWHRFQK